MIIRQACIKDLPAILILYNDLMKCQTNIDIIEHKNNYPIDTMALNDLEILLKHENCLLLIVEEQNKILAFCDAYYFIKSSFFQYGEHIYIGNLNIVSEVQKQKGITIMHLINEEIEKWAISKNTSFIVADIHAKNDKMLKFGNRFSYKLYNYRVVKEIATPLSPKA